MDNFENLSSGNSEEEPQSELSSRMMYNFQSLINNPSAGTPIRPAGMPFRSTGVPFRSPGTSFHTSDTPFSSSDTPFSSSGTPFSTSGTPFPRQSSQPAQPPPPQRSRNPPYMIEEDTMLCHAWVATSVDPIHGNDQSSDKFWDRIFMYYSRWLENAPMRRDARSLQNRWSIIKQTVGHYRGCIGQVEHRHPSGTNDQDTVAEADRIYEELYNKKFALKHCWLILRLEQKWIDSLGSNSSRKGKGKRSSDSSGGSESEPIDLNDGLNLPAASKERPMGTQAAKRKAKAKTEEPFNFKEAMSFVQEIRESGKKEHEQEKKERYERQMKATERQMKATEQMVHLNKMEWEHKIMSMDLSTMDPVKANYYRKRQEQITKSLEDESD